LIIWIYIWRFICF